MVEIIKTIKQNKVKVCDRMDTIAGYFDSPMGLIKICGNEHGITSLDFVHEKDQIELQNEIIIEAILQLKEYFNGNRKEFNLPVFLEGTAFQIRVWEMLTTVKYGRTATYKDIASLVNNEKASRAIGGANNKNPVAIIIPCHRIIGSNGKLIGYAGGLDKKQWLLEHEMRNN